ncbi:DeoR/GlpR family DNA-binding transcription regulator [Bacillus pseudomycoides]|uniref:DeoR family transcriptional regulator n=1 Tax=Bacillus pseudomycoides TaxID=64104 RepID=A0A2B6II07_9BACI|nr:DeoR/GlpR family DNA-binding transcription regulator [Bacillus pseudomycoides]PDY48366.1 DeoR family transcriptional regulator [Bacillus pseudomycoides]PEA83902.1 DeoR family transcriptional regulator [Bacillus pseudomycoides]PED73745.1 DeoR family transcriptional regulator [Bacillus pseudomycoides]PEI38699.1 DeoR family transcriptional regulator [Bacillus pseudomycoides]PEJ78878.1 DeoR family transcriptional regulator [Bacillus pseudomycoides]
MSIVGEERKRSILEKVEFKGKVKVSELASEFSVSTETIRRYLEELDREKKLKKVYGGAVQLPGAGIEPPMLEREMLYIEEKKRIGYKAATFVEDGDVIVIDDGSTPLQMVPYLVHRKNLTVVTSSFPVAAQLISSINKKMFDGEVLFIGGKVSPKHCRVSGSISQQVIRQFHFHKAFISIDGLLPSFGISSFELEKAKLSEAMIQLAEKTFILCDHTKLGVKGNYRIAGFSDIGHVICDKKMPHSFEEFITKNNIRWTIS